MKEMDSDDPLPFRVVKSVGIVYNLKKDDTNSKKNIAVDTEAEYDNIDTIYAIEKALRDEGFNVELLEADESLSQKLHNTNIDIVFNIAEGKNGRGREAQIPALLNMFNIPFTGSDETTLCIALDKSLTKRLLSTYHIKTPKYKVISRDTKNFRIGNMKYPLIVKPNSEGSSKGISDVSIVESKEELINLVKQNIRIYNESMLIEEYIEGREFTVGIIGNGDELTVFRPMEIVYEKATQANYHVYSYKVKQSDDKYVHYECPSSLAEDKEREMMKIAERIYTALDCKDFSRIDFRLSEAEEICFIEINPLPGLAPNYSDYPLIAEFCGMDYGELIRKILKSAIKRYNMR